MNYIVAEKTEEGFSGLIVNPVALGRMPGATGFTASLGQSLSALAATIYNSRSATNTNR